MTIQKLLAKYIKAPGIRQIDKINTWANIFHKKEDSLSHQRFYESINMPQRLEQAVEKAKEDFRKRITSDGIFLYRYHPDKLPALIPDTGDMALHQGLALATACVMNDDDLAYTLFKGSLKFIEEGYLVRGFDEKGETNLTPPSLDQLAGLIFGWTFYFRRIHHLRDKKINNFLWNYINKDGGKLKDSKGNYIKGMKSYKNLFLVDGDASVILAAISLSKQLDYIDAFILDNPKYFVALQMSKDWFYNLAYDYGFSHLAEHGHVHFLWWIAWYSFNINMISLSSIYMNNQSEFALRGMGRILRITDGWGMPFFWLIFLNCLKETQKKVSIPNNLLQEIEQDLYGYIIPCGLNQKDREGKFLWWKWFKTPISPRAGFNWSWMPEVGNHRPYNNMDPDLWNDKYFICYARHDLIFQYELLQKLIMPEQNKEGL